MRRLSLFLPVPIFLAAAMCLPAQTPTGTIQGLVQDITGGVVPEVKIQITNANTNEVKELTTDSTGRFVQPFLLPGTYTVSAEKSGFRPVRQENIRLNVSQNRSVDIILEVGAVTQEVRVEATPAPIDVNTSSIGQVVDVKRIMDLPLNGRSAFSLANLTPGVNPTGGGATPGMGGSRNAISELQIDGVTDIAPENNVGINQRVYEPQVDAVEEFSVQVNALAAEYGRFGGGVINVATKAGTNKVHGTAYDYLRNAKMDANNFFANRAGRAKGGFKRNQWGGTMGGPIVIPHVYNGRDKSFFFFGYEATNARTQSVYTDTVPIEAWRAGDFSNLRTSSGAPITIYDPLTVRPDPANPGKYIRDPFSGNRVPDSRIDPVARKSMTYYPQPNITPTNAYTNTNNFTSAGSAASDSYRVDTRVDQNWTNWWRMFARVSVGWYENTPFNRFGNVASPSGTFGNGGQRSLSLDHTFTFSPTLLGNLRYGFGRNLWNTIPIAADFDPATLGFPQYLTAAAARNQLVFPRLDMGGVAASLGMTGWDSAKSAHMVHSLSGSLTKILARHTIKAGGEYRKLLLNYQQFGYPSGQFSFSSGWTQQEIATPTATAGFPLASFLLGLPSGGYISHDPTSASASSYFAGYIQDDWKITQKLTLNLGLRYDLDIPRTERFDQYAYFNLYETSPIAGKVPASACPSCGNLLGAMHFTDASNRRQTPTDKNNFGPRFGFAYNVAPKTVIRGGYGIAYAPSAMQAAGSTGTAGMDGFATTTNFTGTLDSMRSVKTYLRDPFPDGFYFPPGRSDGALTNLGLGFSGSIFDAYRNPYIQQWNLNVQREIPGDMVVEVGYLGNHGVALVDGDGGQLLNQLPASYMKYGSDLLQLVPNPFYGIITNVSAGSLRSQNVSWGQLQRPYPQYGGLSSFRKPIAFSIYHGMTIRVDKRFAKGYSILLAYTAGKAIDNASNAVSFLGQISGSRLDQYNRRLERSVSSQDVAQRMVISYLWELPFGKGKRFLSGLPSAVNVAVSGWQVNGITTLQSGLPLIITVPSNNTGIYTGTQRPNNTGQSAKISGGTKDSRMVKWFDTSVFSQPPTYTFGTTGRTLPDVRGPGQRNTELSIFKNTYIGPENRANLQYRLEMFNAFNTTQFSTPGTQVNTGSFGVISGTGIGPRQIQMALKLLW